MKESGTKGQRTDYETYRPGLPGLAVLFGEGFAIGCAVCWLAYNSVKALPLAGVVALIFAKTQINTLKTKRKQTLLYHFKDFASALQTALQAGYAVDQGVVSAANDVALLYGDRDVLTLELKNIAAQLQIRSRVEDLFADLGERAGLEDIRLFAQLLAIAKRTGGDMNRMLMQITRVLCDKIDTKQEIDAQIAAKAFEQKIMSLMPACIIVYMRVSFRGFIETLYGNLFGVLMMTVCLLVYAAALFWGRKIVHIEIL